MCFVPGVGYRDTVVFSIIAPEWADGEASFAIQAGPIKMLIDFFFTLKDAKIPVSIKEFLILLEAMKKNVTEPSLDDFYYLSRMTLVKDEAHYDKFDKAFGLVFQGYRNGVRQVRRNPARLAHASA